MVKVRTCAIRWVSDDFPGFIEASVRDVRANDHRIIEKVPVLTTVEITAGSAFPLEVWIEAEMDAVEGNEVRVTFCHGIETVDGVRSLDVSASDVIWL